MVDEIVKPVWWIGSTKKDLLALPEEVQHQVGFALFQARFRHNVARCRPKPNL